MSYRQTVCNRAHQLFAFKSSRDSKEVIRQLNEAMQGSTGGKPTPQSSSIEQVDMQQLIESIDHE